MKEEHRNKGIGKAIFKELAVVAQEKVKHLTSLWNHVTHVFVGLCSYGLVGAQGKEAATHTYADLILAKWNQPSIDFYEKYLHAQPQDEWLGMRLEIEGIENLRNITTTEERSK